MIADIFFKYFENNRAKMLNITQKYKLRALNT